MAAEGNPLEENSLLARTLERLTAFTLQAPGGTLAACIAVAALAIMVSVNGLEFKTNRLDLLSPRSEYNRRWLNYLAEFGDRDDAVVVVQGKSVTEIGPVLDELAAECRRDERLFESVMHRRDLSPLKAKALHFLPVEELRRIEKETDQVADLLEQGPAASDPAAALTALNDRLERLGARSPEAAQAAIASYARLAGGLLPAVSSQGAAPPPAFPAAPLPQGLADLEPQYLTAAGGRLGFVLLRLVDNGNKSALGREAIATLRTKLVAARAKHPEVWIGLTGMPIIEHDEMETSGLDTTVSTLVSLIGVALLFAAGYGGLRHAGMACAALLLGIAWSFGFVTLSVGHLNILSASFGAILIGLGIDFGIHYVASYLRLRETGCDAETALLRTAKDVGPGVVTGAITTAAAFFTAGVTEFVGIAELGIVAGGGVLLCLCSALIALPPMILLSDRSLAADKMPKILPVATWLRPFHAAPRAIVTITILVGLGLAAGIGQLRYDHNLLNLQPKRLESSAIERELFTQLDDSVWFAVSICENREELERRRDQFAKLGTVAKIEEISSLTPAADPAKCRAIARIQETTATASRLRPTKLDAETLKRELHRARELLAGEGLTQSPGFFAVAGLKQALDTLPADQAAARLTHYGGELQRRISERMAPLRDVCDPVPATTADLPQELVERFVGKTQKQLLKVYARGNIWDMDRLEKFVAELESVDPLVTGHPVQTYYASRHMLAGYLHAGLMAVVAVFGLVYLDFQSLRIALLAMTPLAVGALSLFGLVGWLGIPLNAANMIVLPLILGIGVDDGVHLAHDFRRQRGRFKLGDSTALAVLLTSLTTMVSFGTMILARHQGLQSLGQVLTLGTLLCLATSLLSFPALLSWLTADHEDIDDEEPPSIVEDASDSADGVPPPHFSRPRRRARLLQSLADDRAES